MMSVAEFDRTFEAILNETKNDKADLVLQVLEWLQNFMDGDLDAEIKGATDEGLFLMDLLNQQLNDMLFKRLRSQMTKAHAMLNKLDA